MPSSAITDLPLGSIDGGAPAEAGWLARQSRRLLVLTALIAGCWLLASILNGAQAHAAPIPVPVADTSAGTALAADSAAKAVPTTQPMDALVSAVPTTMRTLSVTVPATLATVVTTHQVLTVSPVIIARVVHTAPHRVGSVARSTSGGATSAAPGGTVLTRAASRSTTLNSALVAVRHPLAAPASTAAARTTAAQASTSTPHPAHPAGLQRPTSVPSPAEPGAAGPGAGSQSAGGTAIRSLTARFAPTSFMVSAPSSRVAARLRCTRERPSVSPD